ncbi:FAD-binding oxidoreductase [Emcibacter nanhaiensis]|uniref:2Fe-2S iron-sulfur cluster binding domain-containing protein n=1 Tax=Emcibacter nanhaiensis TaxID=1505037 RepID=A0A501PJV4_9PROT|nr:FAD-binding oxidoreductase [Emcibacter nanhaiensis]TPD60174.1 2Fe-2S iron-sulfur cluster binding domain-containing protein [Emcibacter nanhaiensis]
MSGVKHSVTLNFSDGESRRIEVAEDENILDVALDQEVPLLYQCRSGSCAACQAKLVEGSAEMRRDVAASLLKSEQQEGQRLICITTPQSDCTLELDYDSTAGSNQPVRANAFIDAIEWVSRDVVKLSMELADGDWIDFIPGQFIQVKVPGTEQFRSYSFASTPADLPKIELLIRVLEDGVMSSYLRDRARVDDVLEIEGAFGSFFLRDGVKAPHIMIAGGTGLAPMMSMLDVIRVRSGKKPNILLSFGCVDRDGLFYVEELDLRQQWMPTLQNRISVDKGEAEEGILVGNPVSSLASDAIDENAVAYLCGPPGMIEAAQSFLLDAGLKPENIHAEKFVPSE